MNSHIVSKVLLRRFTTKNLVKVHDLVTGVKDLKRPEDLAYIKVGGSLFNKLEKKWGNVETRAATAFLALDRGDLLKSKVHKDAIKRFMALHYLRSQAFFYLMAKSEQEHFKEFIGTVKKDHPDQADEIDANIEAIRERWLLGVHRQIPDLIKGTTEKINDFIENLDIEVGLAPNGVEFVLGDNPVITIANDGRMGILSGVRINESDGVAMALGPRHIAALITRNPGTEYRLLSPKAVEVSNSKTIHQSLAAYYSKP